MLQLHQQDASRTVADQSKTLDADVTAKEILEAIDGLHCSKGPGLNGYPSECYKINKEVLASLLCKVYSEEVLPHFLLSEANRAAITIIPKPGKDLLACSSYRPSSLLNVDMKVFAN